MRPGRHHGWPWREGARGFGPGKCTDVRVGTTPGGLAIADGDCVDPAYWCKHDGAAAPVDGGCGSITGGQIVDTCTWPAPYRGRYVFGDYATNRLFTLTPTAARDGVTGAREPLATTTGGPVAIRTGTDGALYVARWSRGASRASRRAWTDPASPRRPRRRRRPRPRPPSTRARTLTGAPRVACRLDAAAAGAALHQRREAGGTAPPRLRTGSRPHPRHHGEDGPGARPPPGEARRHRAPRARPHRAQGGPQGTPRRDVPRRARGHHPRAARRGRDARPLVSGHYGFGTSAPSRTNTGIVSSGTSTVTVRRPLIHLRRVPVAAPRPAREVDARGCAARPSTPAPPADRGRRGTGPSGPASVAVLAVGEQHRTHDRQPARRLGGRRDDVATASVTRSCV